MFFSVVAIKSLNNTPSIYLGLPWFIEVFSSLGIPLGIMKKEMATTIS